MSQPPYYILYSHSNNPAAPSTALGHPSIQYHYANDSPLALWPQAPDEHVIVLDYDPNSDPKAKPPVAQSLSKDIAVTALKVEDAPGAAAAATNDNIPKDDKMYIIETTASSEAPIESQISERRPIQAVLAQFKRRNEVLRRALLYPESNDPNSPPVTEGNDKETAQS